MRSALLIAAGGLILFLVMLLAAGARGTFAAVDSEAALLGREVAASGADGVTRIVTDFGSLPAAATAAVIAGFALVWAAVFGLSAGILVTIGLMRDTEGESRGAAPPGGNQRT